MTTWIEDQIGLLSLYNEQTKIGDFVLPQHPDESMYQLDSNFRPEAINSVSASRSGNFFSSRVQAAMYGQALATMMRLRHLPGNTLYQPGVFIVQVLDLDGTPDVYAQQVEEPVFSVSGFFLEMDHAETAIELVGANNIAIAHKVLMCIR